MATCELHESLCIGKCVNSEGYWEAVRGSWFQSVSVCMAGSACVYECVLSMFSQKQVSVSCVNSRVKACASGSESSLCDHAHPSVNSHVCVMV